MHILTIHVPTGNQVPVKDEKGKILKDEKGATFMEPEIREDVVRLSEPTFEQIRGAMLAMETLGGKSDRLAAGNFFIVACIHNDDRDKWENITKDPKAHASAAFEASQFLNVYRSEIKKK